MSCSGHRQLPWRDPDDLLEARGPPGPPQDSGSSPRPTHSCRPAVSQAAGSPPGGCSGSGSGLVDSGARPEGPHRQALVRQLETKRKLSGCPPQIQCRGTPLTAPQEHSRDFPGDPVVENLPVHQAGFPSSPPTPPPTNPHQLGSWDPTCCAVWPENKQIFSRCCMSHGGSE